MQRLTLVVFTLFIAAYVLGSQEKEQLTTVKSLPNNRPRDISPRVTNPNLRPRYHTPRSSPNTHRNSKKETQSIPTSFTETNAEVHRVNPVNPYAQTTVLSEVSSPKTPDGRQYAVLSGGASKITKIDSDCVMCQYFIQRMKNDMFRYSANVNPGTYPSFLYPPSSPLVPRPMPFAYPSSSYYNVWLEEQTKITRTPSNSPVSRRLQNLKPVVSNSLLEESSTRRQRHTVGNPKSNQKAAPKAGVTDALTPRRYRAEDMLTVRPPMERVDMLNAPNPNPLREQVRFLQNQVFRAVYQSFEGACASRVPESFVESCEPLLHEFRFIAEGLHFGDRPDVICMRSEYCPGSSYVRTLTPHTTIPSD